MQTILVSEVEGAAEPLATLDRDQALRSLLNAPVEQLSPGRALVRCTDVHPLADAAKCAFYGHLPLVLSPDALWFCLAQGFAHHVALNAESLRERFVRHEGKAKLIVERPDFMLGRPNPWPEVFGAFSEQIAQHVGKLRDLVVAEFSTTGAIERAAFEVALMDTFQPYFEYEMREGCGIPSVTLLGTAEDWRSLRRRAVMFSEFGLEWWTGVLLPVLDQLVLSAEGTTDRAFWQSFFRYQSGSGPAELTGWIQVLFPYLRQPGAAVLLTRNAFLADWQARFEEAETRSGYPRRGQEQGPAINAIPSGVASAPVLYFDRDGSRHPLRFVAGLFGVSQDSTRALVPEFGWAVVHDPMRSSAA